MGNDKIENKAIARTISPKVTVPWLNNHVPTNNKTKIPKLGSE
jgi:hypothetical protein